MQVNSRWEFFHCILLISYSENFRILYTVIGQNIKSCNSCVTIFEFIFYFVDCLNFFAPTSFPPTKNQHLKINYLFIHLEYNVGNYSHTQSDNILTSKTQIHPNVNKKVRTRFHFFHDLLHKIQIKEHIHRKA